MRQGQVFDCSRPPRGVEVDLHVALRVDDHRDATALVGNKLFARPGIYDSPQAFIDGFTQALWVGVGLSAVGAAAALLAPGRRRADQAPAAAQPALALGGERT